MLWPSKIMSKEICNTWSMSQKSTLPVPLDNAQEIPTAKFMCSQRLHAKIGAQSYESRILSELKKIAMFWFEKEHPLLLSFLLLI